MRSLQESRRRVAPQGPQAPVSLARLSVRELSAGRRETESDGSASRPPETAGHRGWLTEQGSLKLSVCSSGTKKGVICKQSDIFIVEGFEHVCTADF